MSEPFLGEIRMFTYGFEPRGWTYCNGQLLTISENTALFSILGANYGGDGRINFAVPNLQAKVPMFYGRSPGLSDYRYAEFGGVDGVALNSTQIPSHDHGAQIIATVSTTSDPAGQLLGTSAGTNYLYKRDVSAFTEMASDVVVTEGQGREHENRQPFLTVSFCIATEGLYPPRN